MSVYIGIVSEELRARVYSLLCLPILKSPQATTVSWLRWAGSMTTRLLRPERTFLARRLDSPKCDPLHSSPAAFGRPAMCLAYPRVSRMYNQTRYVNAFPVPQARRPMPMEQKVFRSSNGSCFCSTATACEEWRSALPTLLMGNPPMMDGHRKGENNTFGTVPLGSASGVLGTFTVCTEVLLQTATASTRGGHRLRRHGDLLTK